MSRKARFAAADIGRLLQAIHFAAEKHRQQRRKDAEGSPYINHPLKVAELLWNAGGIREMDVVLAAVLHDTIEDTATTRREIAKHFGERVARIVCEVTDDKSLEKAERKRLQIEHAPHLSRQAKVIKLADKLCNISDITASPPTGWSLERTKDYLDWSEKVVAGLRGVNPKLEGLFDSALRRGRKQIAKRKKRA